MGLEDVVNDSTPDEVDTSRSRNSGSSDDEEEDKVIIGSPPNRKTFSEERWEEVKKVIREQMEYTVNEVKNLPTAERYEVLHQAATWGGELSDEQEELKSLNRCAVCGKDCQEETSTEISGKRVHTHHTVAQLDKEI